MALWAWFPLNVPSVVYALFVSSKSSVSMVSSIPELRIQAHYHKGTRLQRSQSTATYRTSLCARFRNDNHNRDSF